MLARTSGQSNAQRGKVTFLQLLFRILAWARGPCESALWSNFSSRKEGPNLFTVASKFCSLGHQHLYFYYL